MRVQSSCLRDKYPLKLQSLVEHRSLLAAFSRNTVLGKPANDAEPIRRMPF